MLVIMSSRTIYYLLMHFSFENGLNDKPVENQYLLVIYLQEVIFNFIVFYNLVLKQQQVSNETQNFNEQESRRATGGLKEEGAVPIARANDISSKKIEQAPKTEEESSQQDKKSLTSTIRFQPMQVPESSLDMALRKESGGISQKGGVK